MALIHHSVDSSKGVLLDLEPACWQQSLLVQYSAELAALCGTACLSSATYGCPTALRSKQQLRIHLRRQKLKLFKYFLKGFCFLAGRIILPEKATVIRKYHSHGRLCVVCNRKAERLDPAQFFSSYHPAVMCPVTFVLS